MEISLLKGAFPYLEYGWVCAPNAAGQTITPNTITTLTIDTEISDTGNNGSIASNQITLNAGTYFFEAFLNHFSDASQTAGIFSLYNVTDSVYITRNFSPSSVGQTTNHRLTGQFTIATSKVFDLRFLCEVSTGTIQVRSGSFNNTLTLATAGADQRTTLKLWKLA